MSLSNWCRNLVLVVLCGLTAAPAWAAGRVFSDGFESGVNQWVGGATGQAICTTSSTSVDGLFGPKAGSQMAVCNWAGTSDYTTLRLMTFSYNTEFLVRFWFRVDQDVAHMLGNKMFRLHNDGVPFPDNSFYISANMGDPGNEVEFTSLEVVDGNAILLGGYGPTKIGDTLWHKIEVYFKVGAVGVNTVWVDGVLQKNNTGWSSNAANPWYPMNLMSNWADSGTGDPNNHAYWDEVEIYSDTGTGGTGLMSNATITQTGGGDTTPPAAPTGLHFLP